METYEELYKTVCRVCLAYGKQENMVCLIDKNSEDSLSCYGKAICVFASVSINIVDDLPKYMCQNCLKILKHAIFFKLKCEWSDKQLCRLYKIHKESGSNLKETVVDFLMFNQYLPQEPSQNTSGRASKRKPEEVDPVINEKLANDCDNAYMDDISDIAEDCNDSVDEELNILEKMVAQSSFILPKSEYTTRKKQKVIKRKPLHDKKSLLSQRKIQMRRGITKEKPPDKLICKICQKELANQHTYRYHMERHNGCKFICEHCGKGFPVLVELNMHQVSRHGTGPFLQCPHCTYKAPRKLNLIEHIRIHTGERPYTCDKCGLTFRRSAIWKKHMVYHMEKTVQCPHCPRKFYRRSEMQSHANSIHERMYVYLCHKCDATYAKSETVRRHLAERHGIPRDAQGRITRVNKGEVYGIL